MDYNAEYAKISATMRACAHDNRNCETSCKEQPTVVVCTDCYNAQVYAWRALRKRQLAEFTAELPKCERCGRKPMRWNYGGYELCTACKSATEREHWHNMSAHGANAGFASMLATSPAVDTSTWKALR